MHRRWSESDWKTFRKLAPELRERFLEDMNRELVAILGSGRKSPTKSFWEAEERVQEIAEILRACLDGHSRSRMGHSMILMLRHGLLAEADLKSFSEDLRSWLLEAVTLWENDDEKE